MSTTSARVLFVAQHRPGRSPSQRFRFEQYFDWLSKHGIESDFSYLINAEDDRVLYAHGHYLKKASILIKSYKKRVADIQRFSDYDIIFVQREAFMTGSIFFERAASKSSAKLMFDFDDSIWLPNVSEANRYLNFLKNPSKTSQIIAMSDHIIAGNAYLADYAKGFNPNVSIIPTTIDTEAYQRMGKPSDHVITIGWSGSHTTIQHFEFIVPVLKKLKAKYRDRIRFKVIGDSAYRNDELGVQGLAWNQQDEIRGLSSFDIGIMPLPDDEWAKGKCGLKGLQYMALEIPTIMSPVGVNSSIIADGENGLLASTEEDWLTALESLIENPDLRTRLGKSGRAEVERNFSVSSTANRYVEVFKNVLS